MASRSLTAAVKLLLQALTTLIERSPRDMTDKQWAEFVRVVYILIVQARNGSAIDAGRQFQAEARKHGDDLVPVQMPYYDTRALDDALTRTVREPLRNRDTTVQMVQRRAAAAVERHVIQAGRDTTVKLAVASEAIGWARVLTGAENCAFCVMLASRGPVYGSEKSAKFTADMKRYHDGCDCRVVAVYDRKSWPGRDAYREALRRYGDAPSEGGKLNGLRRSLYADPFTIPAAVAA